MAPELSIEYLQIYEIVTGEPLFPLAGYFTDREWQEARDRDDQIDEAMREMIHTIGKPPPKMLSAWGRWSQWFDADGKGKTRVDTDKIFGNKTTYVVDDMDSHRLETQLQSNMPHDTTPQELIKLGALLRAMLRYNPEERESAEKLLKFNWFTDGK